MANKLLHVTPHAPHWAASFCFFCEGGGGYLFLVGQLCFGPLSI